MCMQAWGKSTGALDWYQTGVGRPDLALKDLVSIVSPGAMNVSEPLFETRFFRNIAAGELTKVIPRPSVSPEPR